MQSNIISSMVVAFVIFQRMSVSARGIRLVRSVASPDTPDDVLFAEFKLEFVPPKKIECLTRYCRASCEMSKDSPLTSCHKCISSKCEYDDDVVPFFDHVECVVEARKQCSLGHDCSRVKSRCSCQRCIDYCIPADVKTMVRNKMIDECIEECDEDICVLDGSSEACIACKANCGAK
ncbi:uncharacterized protein LOC120330307 [Styela clava]